MSECRCWFCSPRDRKQKYKRKKAQAQLQAELEDAQEYKDLPYYPFLAPLDTK